MPPVTEPEWTHTVVGGPWPKRRGRRCRIVTPFDTPGSTADQYPWAGLPADQTIILIDGDPLDGRPLDDPDRKDYEPDPAAVTGWSCCIDKADLAPIGDGRPSSYL